MDRTNTVALGRPTAVGCKNRRQGLQGGASKMKGKGTSHTHTQMRNRRNLPETNALGVRTPIPHGGRRCAPQHQTQRHSLSAWTESPQGCKPQSLASATHRQEDRNELLPLATVYNGGKKRNNPGPHPTHQIEVLCRFRRIAVQGPSHSISWAIAKSPTRTPRQPCTLFHGH